MLAQPPQIRRFLITHVFFLLIVFALIVAYVVTRTTNLTLWPIFADEAIYIRWAQVMRAEPTLRFLPLTDGKQPLFMWLMIPLLKFVSDPLLAGRLLSTFAGLGALIGIIALAYLVTKSRRISLISGVLYVFAPYTLFFDRYALADSLLSMFFIWTCFFAILNASNPQLSYTLITGALFGAAWLTKSPAIFLFALVPMCSLPYVSGLKHNKWLAVRWCISWLMISAIAFAIYNILRLGPEFHQIALRNRDYVYPWNEILADPLHAFLPNSTSVLGFYWRLLTPGLVLFAALAVWRKGFQNVGLSLFLLFWIFAPAMSQALIARGVTARYFLYTVPPFLILSAMGIEVILERLKNFPIFQTKVIVAIAILCISVVPLSFDAFILMRPDSAPLPRIERSGYLEEWTAGVGLRDISTYLQTLPQEQNIIVATEGYFGTTPDGLQIYFDKSPNVRVIGQSPYLDKISDGLYEARKQNRVFLVINNERLHIPDPTAVGLTLLTTYPKSVRPDGSHQSLLFFELTSEPVLVDPSVSQ